MTEKWDGTAVCRCGHPTRTEKSGLKKTRAGWKPTIGKDKNTTPPKRNLRPHLSPAA